MVRRGLNCTFSYPGKGGAQVYRVRCSGLSHGFGMIATESAARTTRAFYPHQNAPTQFGIRVDLIGHAERDSFNNYLMAYAEYILDPGLTGTRTPQMTVSVPSRNFKRVGVPNTGVEFGVATGDFLFQPTVVFETSGEPYDWSDRFYISKVYASHAYTRSPESQFFYPTGLQLNGNEAPVSMRQGDRGRRTTGVQAVQGAINGPKVEPQDEPEKNPAFGSYEPEKEGFNPNVPFYTWGTRSPEADGF